MICAHVQGSRSHIVQRVQGHHICFYYKVCPLCSGTVITRKGRGIWKLCHFILAGLKLRPLEMMTQTPMSVCLCVCVCEKERERECVSESKQHLTVQNYVHTLTHSHTHLHISTFVGNFFHNPLIQRHVQIRAHAKTEQSLWCSWCICILFWFMTFYLDFRFCSVSFPW